MGSTYVVEQLSFSLFLSILTFDFDSILGSFLTFWGPNGLFLGLRKGPNTVRGYTHVVDQLSFSMFPSTLEFDFDLMLGSFLTFWAPMGYFWRWVDFESCFGVYSGSCSTSFCMLQSILVLFFT